jgi:hypothetical protein
VREPDFADPNLVQKLIDPDLSGERLWDESELRDVVAHQLSGPLVSDVRLLGTVRALEAAQLCQAARPAIVSYADLFAHASPPLRVLDLVRQFAQAQLVAPGPQLLTRVARLLYFTSIAVARVRCGSRIADLGRHDLMAGLTWLLDEPWVSGPTRDVLKQALLSAHAERVEGRGGHGVP